MSIDERQVREALAQQQEPECDHPTKDIIDRPDKSYCRKCGQDVAPLMRDGAVAKAEDRDWIEPKDGKLIWHRQKNFTVGMDWMGRTKKSVFPVFPSGG